MADRRTGKARQGTHPKAPAPTHLPGGKAIYRTNSGQAARKVITDAAKRGERVSVKVVVKRGGGKREVREMWKSKRDQRGASADFVKKKLGTSARALKGGLARQAETYDSDEIEGKPFEVDDIQEIQITTYS